MDEKAALRLWFDDHSLKWLQKKPFHFNFGVLFIFRVEKCQTTLIGETLARETFANFKPIYLTKHGVEPYSRKFIQAKFSDLAICKSFIDENFP